MKPPPRKRSKPELNPPEPVLVRSGKWQRFELSRLLTGLKKLSRNATEDREVDCCALKEHVKTRSAKEIQSMVDSQRIRVISCASFTFKKRRREEMRDKKPIELWTHMSSSVAGIQEETINTAFTQMLIVSSKEPLTVKNSDPPRVPPPNPDQSRPAGRTVPFRPMPRPAPGPGSSPAPLLKVTKTSGPTRGLPAPSQAVQVSAPQTQPGSKPETEPGSSLCQKSVSDPPQPGSQTPVTPPPPVPGPASPSPNSAALSSPPPLSSPSAPSPVPLTQHLPLPLSSQAATLCARFGRTSKYATEDSPRVLGVKCVVDFEKIYRYLSSTLKPAEECCLTPMEGAIMLDLLMSLPEELPQLDCNNLRKHLTQVYQTLSTPDGSKLSRDMLKDLQHGSSPGAEPLSNTQQSGGTTSTQDADLTRACPPLNPFMVPVKLLKRRATHTQNH